MTKQRIQEGTRLQLLRMNQDPHPVPTGTCGTVSYIDDAGQIHMKWDNGSRLALIPNVDEFFVIG